MQVEISQNAENEVDVVFLTALEIERDAVLSYLENVQRVDDKHRTFHRATIGDYRIIVSCMNGMGNTRAGVLTQQAIAVWNPAYIFLTGIAAGVKKGDSRLLGDVVVAEQVVDYELGRQEPSRQSKQTDSTTEADTSTNLSSGLKRRYEAFRPAEELLRAAQNLPARDWALAIKSPRPDGTSERVLSKAHFGVVLSGQKVVTDPKMVEELQSDWAQMAAVEMEGVGVALAAYLSETAPGCLLIKGICDWADPTKNDDWQLYAAHASAAFASSLLQIRPFERRSRPQAERKENATEQESASIVAPTAARNVAQRTSSPPGATYSGRTKLTICQRLIDDWQDLADFFDVPLHMQGRFEKGREAQAVWEWLALRSKLPELPQALTAIGRDDLSKMLQEMAQTAPTDSSFSGPPS